MTNIKMLVVTHKPYIFPSDDIYYPIQVNSNKNADLGYFKDNDGKDNISDKNTNYCELTALYWAWKHLKCDVIGINHYRRYLSVHSKREIARSKTMDDKFRLILNSSEINELLEKYDVLVPSTKLIIKNVYSKYDQQHYIKDLKNCKEVISKLYPDYIQSFDKVMLNKEYAICNMCVMRKELFDDYCKWLFDVLFGVEKITDMTGYSQLQQRIYGFLSERLFNVWLEKNKLRVRHLNMVAMEHDSIKTIIMKSYRRIMHIKS